MASAASICERDGQAAQALKTSPGETGRNGATTQPRGPLLSFQQGPRRGSPRPDQVQRREWIGEIDRTRWQTELYLTQIEPKLRQFFGGLQGQAFSKRQIEALFDSAFRGAAISASARAHQERNGLVHRTWTPASEHGLNRDEFAADWLGHFRGFGMIRRTEHHVSRIDVVPTGTPGELRAGLLVHFRVTGMEGTLNREDLGVFDVDFLGQSDSGAWRMERLSVREMHSVRAAPQFKEVTRGLEPSQEDDTDTLFVAYFAQGVSLADFDGDGDLDIFAPRRHSAAVLYANEGSAGFRDVTAEVGLSAPQGVRSVYFFDWDNDGDLDVLLLTANRMFLFENRDGHFTDISDASGFDRMFTDGLTGAAVADYDMDGLLDFYVANYGNPAIGPGFGYFDSTNGYFNLLWHNEGNGRFADATVPAGLNRDNRRWTYAALWIDYDDDGALDLYVVNDYGPNQLFRNQHDGTFTDVTSEAGVADYGNGMGASWADYDNDGKLDLYISNMHSHAGKRMIGGADFPGDTAARNRALRFAKGNTLLRNVGGGRFIEIDTTPVLDAKWAWGNVFFDYDNDGDQDLYVANGMFSNLSVRETDPVFWRHVLVPLSVGDAAFNEGAGFLGDLIQTDTHSLAGYERNRFFQNLGDGQFAEVAAVVNTDLVQDGRGVASGDLDGDGDLDLVLSNRNPPNLAILRNDAMNPGNYLAVNVVGTESNRQGIGTKIHLSCDGKEQVRVIQLGTGYVSQSAQTAWFGLSDCRNVDHLVLRWPSGQSESLSSIEVNRTITVIEGAPGQSSNPAATTR